MNNLKIGHWWRAFTAIGATNLVAAVAVKQRDPMLLAISSIGFGQWINHPVQNAVIKGWLVNRFARNPKSFDVCREILGSMIFIPSIIRIYIAVQVY